MSLHQQIGQHRSIRKYHKRAVDDVVLDRIIEAGIRASSSGNMQAYSIVITRDENLRKELHQAHFCQDMVLEAPVLATFCADFRRMKKWLELNQAPQNFDNFMSFLIGMIDATLVSQNMALAAEQEGLGICYMGTTLANCEEVGRILKLPPNVVPVVGYVLGWPAESPPLRDRLPREGLIHYETYQDQSDKEIEEIYRERNTKGMQRYMADPVLRQKVEEHKVENLAQVYTRLKYTRESHLHYSESVLNYLIKQNFMNFGNRELI